MEDSASVTSTTLLVAARQEHSEAWRRLVQLYGRRMYRWCRVAGLQPADAANVVQESFAAAARKLVDFRHDQPGATFRGWLRRIVDNKIRDHYRVEGRRAELVLGGSDAHRMLVDAAAAGPDPDPPRGEAWPGSDALVMSDSRVAAVVNQVRQDVGERDWRIFWRTAVDGQSAPDVAREHDVTANAVRIVKMRVLKRIRGHFEQP